MADIYTTLADLVKINDKNATDVGVTDLFDDAPLLAVLAADESSNGTTHKWIAETSAVPVGFRDVNVGLENKASADTLRFVDLKILDASFGVDAALADAYFRGTDAYIAREAIRHLKAAMFSAEQQIINGTDNDGDGFAGLADVVDGLDDPTAIDAGGSFVSGSPVLTSCYLVRTNDAGTDVTVVMANGGQIEVGETVSQRLSDSDGKHYPGYYTPVQAWMGLQYGSLSSVARIGNLGTAEGTTLTDDLIYEALALFAAGRQPNYIVMNRRSLEQLRASRTATNTTGAPAPRPTDVEGIPIVVTDAIGNDENEVS
jgi:hypothetical protein